MAGRFFLNEKEWSDRGFTEPTLRLMRRLVNFANTNEAIAAAQNDINANASSIADLAANDTALQSQITTLDSRLDNYDTFGPYVRQGQAVAPVFTPYAGQTVSAAYVQAEAQATDDAAKANSIAIAAIITALQAANVLT